MEQEIAKGNDIRARKLMLEAAEICLRVGQPEAAKSMLADSKKLADRIDTHDYSKEERLEQIIAGNLTNQETGKLSTS